MYVELYSAKLIEHETYLVYRLRLVWYGILEFNVPLDTVYVISETGPWAVMYISHSVLEGQQHNNPLNPRCFCLQRPKRDGTSS